MADLAHQLALYLHLARASQRRQRPLVRDRWLILAGVAAARLELPTVAAYCRCAVLQNNPGHLIRRWTTVAEALDDNDFMHFLKQLQRRYPLEKAERMLSSLGIDMARERDAYYSDLEYAASLLGMSIESLNDVFGDGSSE